MKSIYHWGLHDSQEGLPVAIQACPFCKSFDVGIAGDSEYADEWVKCFNFAAEGPDNETEQEAIEEEKP